MRNDDWNDLGEQWRDAVPGDNGELVRGITARIRRHRLGLYVEIGTTGAVLGMIATGWLASRGTSEHVAWYSGAAVLLLLLQTGALWLRRRHGLFAAAPGGITAWIDAERDRARYVIAYLWWSVLGGLGVIAWAALTVRVLEEPLLLRMIAVVSVVTLGYAIVRTLWLRRWLRQLAARRIALE